MCGELSNSQMEEFSKVVYFTKINNLKLKLEKLRKKDQSCFSLHI